MIQPDYPSAMGLLAHLNSDELKEMLNDDTKFDSVLKDVKQVKDWETEKEMIIASNRSLAEFNLSKEPELNDMKAQVQEKSESGEQLCSRIQELLDEYKTKSAGISPDTTHALLQTAAAESEEQSENTASEFLAGKIDVEKFLEDFEPIRKKMHLRKFKAEKMGELLRTGSQGSYGNGLARPYLPYPSYGSQNVPSVPYPMGPLNMPMPGMYGDLRWTQLSAANEPKEAKESNFRIRCMKFYDTSHTYPRRIGRTSEEFGRYPNPRRLPTTSSESARRMRRLHISNL